MALRINECKNFGVNVQNYFQNVHSGCWLTPEFERQQGGDYENNTWDRDDETKENH